MNREKKQIIRRIQKLLAELDELEKPGAGKKILDEWMQQITGEKS